MEFQSVRYETEGRVATITLNRPEHLNAIDMNMPAEIEAAVTLANEDDSIHAIVLTGAGRGFCSGYDLKQYAEAEGAHVGSQLADGGGAWDPMRDYYMMKRNTEQFMSLWRSYKPTIAKINGPAVAGGSDIALCCDFVIMAEDAKIGYPPVRVWGCPTTAMWVYRLGAQLAKRMLFTGDLISGVEAKEIGLALDAVPAAELVGTVEKLVQRVSSVPKNQLMMQKLMINQAYQNMGLENTQMFATLFDGITRHSPEGVWFKQRAEEAGFKQAVKERDSGDPIAPDASGPLSS